MVGDIKHLCRFYKCFPTIRVDNMNVVGSPYLVQQSDCLDCVFAIHGIRGFEPCVQVQCVECILLARYTRTFHPISHLHVVHREDFTVLTKLPLKRTFEVLQVSDQCNAASFTCVWLCWFVCALMLYGVTATECCRVILDLCLVTSCGMW